MPATDHRHDIRDWPSAEAPVAPSWEWLLDRGFATPQRAILLIAVSLALSWVVGFALGGAAIVAPHWFYLPIILAGRRFGLRGALLTALLATIVAGPLLPADRMHGTPQNTADWLSRGVFFVLLGAVFARLLTQLQVAFQRELSLVQAQRDRAVDENAARRLLEEQLRHQAFHDPLTALPNRALFLDRVQTALARANRHDHAVAVLVLDLDRFKVVNDSLGHATGDQLLIKVAARLEDCLRAEDTVARLGGDEFAILLNELREGHGAVRTVERVMNSLRTPFRLCSHDVVVATSAGIVTSTASSTADDLLRDADAALYRAKAKGRGHYEIFDATMNALAVKRLELESDLHLALERSEFMVYYQPKIALGTERIVGMEALVRWNSPTRGLVPPGEFIPLAEETGLILPLGRWVLEEACRQSTRWNTAGVQEDLVVSVNLSARQFVQPTLVEEVERAIRATGANPRHLQLEITESVAMGDAEATVQTLQRLKALGVELAIDDFGTGYSSLAYLKRFPLDVLKIDRAFVSGLQRDSDDTSIINAVVSLARALRLTVVAEGVETADEAAQLHELGCTVGQGYYWAKPLPPTQADSFVEGRRHAAPAIVPVAASPAEHAL